MKISHLCFIMAALMMPFFASAQLRDNSSPSLTERETARNGFKSAPGDENQFLADLKAKADTSKPTPFKPTIQVGGLMHAYFELAQPMTSAGDPDENSWGRNFTLYRARILLGASLSPKGSFFIETDLPTPLGSGAGGNPKNATTFPIILDCQYEHVFSDAFMIVVGKQLVSNNRNGLQGAASLMANDFTHYQYSYNMFESSPLQGNYGRDLGVNTRGFFLKDKLEYRLGVFTGRRFSAYSPLRVVGRLAYNFLEPEKDYYYAGTKLGTGKTFALAAGVDAQSNYMNVNADAFLDIPVGEKGAVTANAAIAYQDGGKEDGTYSFYSLIPRQTVQFLELGYYFKPLKIQPWIKFENQKIMENSGFYGMTDDTPQDLIDDENLMGSNMRIGGGINYFFNGYNTNVKLSYTEAIYSRTAESGTGVERASAGQVWVQVQVFFF